MNEYVRAPIAGVMNHLMCTSAVFAYVEPFRELGAQG
jgi:hypothetical protein